MKTSLFSVAGAMFGLLLLAPSVALAQYGGGGIIGGPFSIGYVNTGSASTPTPTSNAGSVADNNTSGQGKVLGASAYNFTSNIQYGMNNADVSALQTMLISDGYLKITAPTGWFGPLTLAAVKKYQAANNLPATGFVGPLTRAVLNKGNISVNTTKGSVVSKIVGAAQGLWGAWEATRAH
jgi:peptidoglycan hydrolase-like protein with peptidoglycan-binding domain